MNRRACSTFRISVVAVTFSLGSLAYAETPKVTAPTLPPVTQPGLPGVDAEPNSTSASFGDWVMRCQRIGADAKTERVCEVAQQINSKDQQVPVAQLAIGRLKKADPFRLTFVLPVNVTLTNSPTFSAGTEKPEPLDLGWRKCMPGGCLADAVLTNDMLLRWESLTAPGRVTWKDASGRDIAVAISFRGLAQALDALNKEPLF